MPNCFSCTSLAILFSVMMGVVSTSQHMICKTLENVFTEEAGYQQPVPSRVLQGPAGKIGPRGIKGERGLPGTIDRQEVERVVEEKLNLTTEHLLKRIEFLEKQMAQLNSTSSHEDAASIRCDGVMYSQKCYFAVIHQNQDVRLASAKQLCRDNRARLGDIIDPEHQEMIIQYLRSKKHSGSSHVLTWVGLLYPANTLKWSDGRNVNVPLTWIKGFPESNSDYDSIGIIAQQSNDGLFNRGQTYETHGALCEK